MSDWESEMGQHLVRGANFIHRQFIILISIMRVEFLNPTEAGMHQGILLDRFRDTAWIDSVSLRSFTKRALGVIAPHPQASKIWIVPSNQIVQRPDREWG